MKVNRLLLAALLVSSVILAPDNLPSCGPFFEQPLFVGTRDPLEPMSEFAAGRLGVIQPTWRQMYLLIAYRYLSGNPLAEVQQLSFVAPSNNQPESQPVWAGYPETPALQKWLDTRARVVASREKPTIKVHRLIKGSDWQSYVNCSDDAFYNAARTLDERIRSFGAANPSISEWVRAQDAVFSNCSQGDSAPQGADPTLPPILIADREYQIAAADFYSEHYDRAAARFRGIAFDKSSPWSGIAPYLAARCLVRKATVSAPEFKVDKAALGEAETELKALLGDSTRSATHGAARKLLNYVELRLHPVERMGVLARQLQSSEPAADFAQDLTDYLYLLEHSLRFPELKTDALRQSDDMTDWIASMSQESGDFSHCLEKWKETGSTPWLLASIVKVPASNPEWTAVTEAVRQIGKDAPAYPTVAYHRLRLLITADKVDEARDELDALLPELRALAPVSSLNLFLAQRMSLARNLDEFVRFAPRQAAGTADFSTLEPVPAGEKDKEFFFDADSLKTFNLGLPLAMLRQAIRSPSLPARLRRQLLSAAWVRAVLISDRALARSLALEMEPSFPEMGSDLREYLSAKEAESSEFAAVWLLLRFPGLSPLLKLSIPVRKGLSSIDDFRENWWCSFRTPGELDNLNFERYLSYPDKARQKTSPRTPDFPNFMTPQEKTAFDREWKRLAGTGCGPDFLGRTVLAWAARHPEDERVPQALHLVVKATRFGCNEAGTWRYSQSAFRLLHTRYPDTRWAKMTPYWFR
jgi:hypothetical protein